MPVLVMPVVVVVVAVVMPGFVVPVMPVFVPLLCDDLVLPPRVRNSLQVVGVFFEVGAVVVLIVVVIIKVTRVVCLLVFVAVGITAIVLLASSPRVATTSPPTAAAVSIAMMVVPAVLVPTVAKTRQQGRRANMLNRTQNGYSNEVITFQHFNGFRRGLTFYRSGCSTWTAKLPRRCASTKTRCATPVSSCARL